MEETALRIRTVNLDYAEMRLASHISVLDEEVTVLNPATVLSDLDALVEFVLQLPMELNALMTMTVNGTSTADAQLTDKEPCASALHSSLTLFSLFWSIPLQEVESAQTWLFWPTMLPEPAFMIFSLEFLLLHARLHLLNKFAVLSVLSINSQLISPNQQSRIICLSLDLDTPKLTVPLSLSRVLPILFLAVDLPITHVRAHSQRDL